MAYVYQVKHRVTGEFYIGSKYAVGATPENTMCYLGSPKGKRARCSRYKYLISNEKHLLDKIIVGVFDTKAAALACEIEMHQKLFDDALCLNGAKQTSTKFSAVFKKEEHPMFGKVLSADARQKMRFAKLGKPRGSHSAEHKEKIRLSQVGKKLTEEHKQKLRAAKVGATRRTVITTCPHCHKEGCSRLMSRYHFDKCKYKEQVCQQL
jgi:hypothetical protein